MPTTSITPYFRSGHTSPNTQRRYVLPELAAVYERRGITGVCAFVESMVSSILGEIYGRLGIAFDGRISFSRLADAGIIDEDTAVYLTTTYMAVESLLEELEEAEDMGDRGAVHSILQEVTVELQKLVNALANLV